MYAKLFVLAHAGQDRVIQPAARLHLIADKLVQIAADTGKEPKRSVEDSSMHGMRHALNSFRLQEERDVSSLRIASRKTSDTSLSNFKAVTLAPLHSLVKDWEPQHKAARPRVREDATRMLTALAGKPAPTARD